MQRHQRPLEDHRQRGEFVYLNLQGTDNAQCSILWQTNLAQPIADWLAYPGSTTNLANANGQWSITVTNPAPADYRVKAAKSCN